MHRKISHTMRNLAWCTKSFGCFKWFRMVCEISHSHAKLLVVGFLPLIFFLASLIAWQRARKYSKAWILHVFELQLALPLISQDSPFSWLVSMIKKLPKTPKLAKNWLITLARLLNVSIELKCINYYSKVFKTVSFKL